MQNILTKLLFVSLLPAAACFLQACTSDTPDIVPAEERQEMKFTTADVSRASTSSINFAGSKFALFGDMKYSTNSPVEVFNNIEVEYDGTSWNYAGTQYWHPKHEHSFVAIHPAGALKNADDPVYTDSKLSFTYTIPTTDGTTVDKDHILDLLAATHRRMYNDGGTGAVSLKFGHLMSLVNIAPAFSDNIISDDGYILIHELQLSGIATESRFDILPAPRLSNSQTDDILIDVVTQDTRTYTIALPAPVQIKNHAEKINLFADNDEIIMLPQTFAADSEAKITFHFSINDENTIRQASLPLKNLKWENGKSYIYKVTIDRTGLVLDKCEINSWNEIRGDEISVD